MKMNRELSEVIGMFAFPGTFVEAIPYGNGHINDTYRLTFEQSGRLVHYILQQMNRKVFRKPEELMEKYKRLFWCPQLFIPTSEGMLVLHLDDDGECR